jgi:hypothetical protein
MQISEVDPTIGVETLESPQNGNEQETEDVRRQTIVII